MVTAAASTAPNSLVGAILSYSYRISVCSKPTSSRLIAVATSSTRTFASNIRRNTAVRMSSSTSSDNAETIRVALLQFRVTEDKEKNLETARDFLLRAKNQNAKLAVLPEIWNSPYATSAFAEYAEEIPNNESDHSPSVSFLMQSAKDLKMWIVGGSIPEKKISTLDKVHYYNTCIICNPEGEIVAKHRKVHLFDIDVPNKITFRESDTLTGGSTITTFDAFGVKIGIGICYDIRFPELSQCMVKRGCRILVFPGAFNLVTGPAHWELLQRARAVDGQCFVLTASPARTTTTDSHNKYPPYYAWGHSTAINPWGEVIATCDENEHVVICDLDMTKVEEMRQGIPTSMQKRTDLYELKDLEAISQK